MLSDLGTGLGVFADILALLIGGYAIVLNINGEPLMGTSAFLAAVVAFGIGRLVRFLIGGA